MMNGKKKLLKIKMTESLSGVIQNIYMLLIRIQEELLI